MTAITLTHPTAGAGATPLALELPDQLSWPDEFTWEQVEQSADYTTTGALVLDAWRKKAGRPITLAGAVDRAWCERATLLTLRTWASLAGQAFTLSLRGAQYAVVFNHGAGALSADAVVDLVDPQPDDPYVLTIRLLEI